MSIVIFAGSMEFMTVSLLQGAFHPLQTLLMTLMLNARHLFYGISMLERYQDMGKKRPYLIFGMCDETFSVNCTAQVPEGVDKSWFYFFITLLDQIYWVLGATLGGIFGSFIHFNTQGLDFVMTAMFVVIFLEHWMSDNQHVPALLGLGLSEACLLLFGSSRFLIPAMVAILVVLTLLRSAGKEATL
jgi:4-azaleucine resistance transporter AzlC